MALKFGKNSTRTSSSGNPITTASFTVERNERVLVLMLKVVGGTDRAGGAPTFGGQTMLQASSTQKAVSSPEASAEIWYLLDPPVGASTCTIPNTGSATIFYTLATAKSTSIKNGMTYLEGANGGNNTSTNPTPGSVTVVSPDAIGFAITAGGWTTWAPSAQAGTIIANTDDGAHGGGEQYLIVSSPGSSTLSWTFGTSDDWGAVAAYFSEDPAVAINNYQHVTADSGISVTEKIR